MKLQKYSLFKIHILLIFVGGLSSCEDFLNRPTADIYTIDAYYKTDAQCFQAVNPLYGSPWYDFQRGFWKIGDVMSGNLFYNNTSDVYSNFTLKSSDVDLQNASASLWSVNAYCNGIIENINLKAGSAVTQKTKNTVKGEALTWKAMAYFYLVRIFGAVPIIHSNSDVIAANQSNNLMKNRIEDVYLYIVKDLEKAIELLPEMNQPGRIDKYSAMGLLAKVYLTKSGVGLQRVRNQADLDQAAFYANKVIRESGRNLMPKFSDIFRLKNNFNSESLIAWHWTVDNNAWTSQNSLQSDLGLVGFSEYADTWGTWTGPSLDLQTAFDETPLNKTTRNNADARRKATMMMNGDHYEYFWMDKGGFNYDWGNNQGITWGSNTGSNCVKNLVGSNSDHIAGIGYGMARMKTSLSTHLLRLSDVYLVYAEAKLGNNSSTSDASALAAFNAVRARSVSIYTPKTSLSFDDIFKERRLELACEGDFWYDFVRLSYYNPEKAKLILMAQERGNYWAIQNYYIKSDAPTPALNHVTLNESAIFFQLPFPDVDLLMNPYLKEEPVAFDFSKISF